MKKHFILIAVLMALNLTFSACDKKVSQIETRDKSVVYVVGYETNAQGKSVATLWKNGKSQYLTNGSNNASANSIFVLDNDLYTSGSEVVTVKRHNHYLDEENETEEMRPIIWKNGNSQRISLGDKEDDEDAMEINASANSVYVYGNNDVYVTGIGSTWAGGNSSEEWSWIWKNGTLQFIKSGINASASCIQVSGGDVYVSGHGMEWPRNQGRVAIYSFATLWKNGSPQRLSNSRRMATANAVFVSDGDVYVAGDEENAHNILVATLWKNGTAQLLGEGENHSYAKSVYVIDGEVYVAGYENCGEKGQWVNNSIATLWVNGSAQRLGDGKNPSVANAVFVLDKDVYILQSRVFISRFLA